MDGDIKKADLLNNTNPSSVITIYQDNGLNKQNSNQQQRDIKENQKSTEERPEKKLERKSSGGVKNLNLSLNSLTENDKLTNCQESVAVCGESKKSSQKKYWKKNKKLDQSHSDNQKINNVTDKSLQQSHDSTKKVEKYSSKTEIKPLIHLDSDQSKSKLIKKTKSGDKGNTEQATKSSSKTRNKFEEKTKKLDRQKNVSKYTQTSLSLPSHSQDFICPCGLNQMLERTEENLEEVSSQLISGGGQLADILTDSSHQVIEDNGVLIVRQKCANDEAVKSPHCYNTNQSNNEDSAGNLTDKTKSKTAAPNKSAANKKINQSIGNHASQSTQDRQNHDDSNNNRQYNHYWKMCQQNIKIEQRSREYLGKMQNLLDVNPFDTSVVGNPSTYTADEMNYNALLLQLQTGMQNVQVGNTRRSYSTSSKTSHHSNKRSPSDNYPQNEPANHQMFENYLESGVVNNGIKQGTFIKGAIRINAKNFEEAFVPHTDGQSDIFISGTIDRNRALNTDIVAVKLYPVQHWLIRVEDELLNQLHTQRLKSLSVSSISDVEIESDTEHPDTFQPSNNNTDYTYSCSDVSLESNSTDTKSSSSPVTCEKAKAISYKTTTHNSMHSDQSKSNPSQPNALLTHTVPVHNTSKVSYKSSELTDRLRTSSVSLCEESKPASKTNLRPLHDLYQSGDLSLLIRHILNTQGRNHDVIPNNFTEMLELIPDSMLKRKGRVVAVIEQKHSRTVAGHLRPIKNSDKALFSPNDHRVPRFTIFLNMCPRDFSKRFADYQNTLFIGKIKKWKASSKLPEGILIKHLGEAGEIEPETTAMLEEYGVTDEEFSEKVLRSIPALPWSIPEAEFKYRADFRNECVFTIDPLTARDLDDALHCKPLENGRFEIGVHIADVSYFVKASSALNNEAASRSTSVYLVQKVIPMLPQALCENLCSLNPGEDRLSFSVIWEFDEEGKIYSEKFTRSIISSCCKLNYESAQRFIDEPSKQFDPLEFPSISHGYDIADIQQRVLWLNNTATKLRAARFQNGALKLDNVKLSFSLDNETGLPNGFSVFEQKDSNRLIEEFMLLANMAVARKIYNTYPELAVLRRHPAPQTRMIDELNELCTSLGIDIDTSSSKNMQETLQRYYGDDFTSKSKLQVLTNMCSRPMQNAKYFCSGSLEDTDLYFHYALAVPLYTHFTSPIRRFPDIMVHRLLAASLGYIDLNEKSTNNLMAQCEYSNDKKTNAKSVQEVSSQMFVSIFIKKCGPLEEEGMVIDALDKSFDVLVLRLGVIKRVYCDKLPLSGFSFRREAKRPILTLTWLPSDKTKSSVSQEITIFTHVYCVLAGAPEPLKWNAFIKHPDINKI